MTTKEDTEYLAGCLEHTSKQEGIFPKGSPFVKKLWWGNEDMVIIIACILVKEGYLSTPQLVVDFFAKPYNWEMDMKEIVKSQETMITQEKASK